MTDRFAPLLQYFLPSFLLAHFELTGHQETDDVLHLTLEELNVVPSEFSGRKLHSKGFFQPIQVQDFPIRGHRVFLTIKRRRWIDLETEQVVFRDWKLIAEGTRMTEEFAAFLKEVNRYPAL
jgi:hypothetical protein